MKKYGHTQDELPLGRFINHMENVPHMLENLIYKLIGYFIPETICLVAMVVFLFL